MIFSTSRITVLLSCLGLLPTVATAQNVINQNTTIRSYLCVGTDCLDTELYTLTTTDTIRLKSNRVRLHIEDTSSATSPGNDWRFLFNDTQPIAGGGENYFAVEDSTSGAAPFRVNAGAPSNALFVATNGNVGLGTMLPVEDLHIESDTQAGLRMNAATTPSGLRSFQLTVNDLGFSLFDATTGQTPFIVTPSAPSSAFQINPGDMVVNNASADLDFTVRSADGSTLLTTNAGTNNVGIGTSAPEAPLEVGTPDAFAFFRLTADGAATNKSVDFVFTQGPLGTGQLRYNIVEAGDSPQVPEMTLDADGNMTLTGTLTTTGPTCAGGCDRVFDADYALPSIEDHAARMFAEGYLPGIGVTAPSAPINLSERQGQILNALEHAHIYIAQLQSQVTSGQEETARQARELAQVNAKLEAVLVQLAERN